MNKYPEIDGESNITFSETLEERLQAAHLIFSGSNLLVRSQINHGIELADSIVRASERSVYGWGGSHSRSKDYLEGRLDEVALGISRLVIVPGMSHVESAGYWRNQIEHEAQLRSADPELHLES